MKKRRSFIDKVKQEYKKRIDAIKNAVILIIMFALFIVGYFVSWSFLNKPLNDNQIKACKQVAHDVYYLKIIDKSEIPKEYSVNTTIATITVRSANILYRGKVIAKLQNGELVMTPDMETFDAIYISVLLGILFMVVPVLIIAKVGSNYKENKKVKVI